LLPYFILEVSLTLDFSSSKIKQKNSKQFFAVIEALHIVFLRSFNETVFNAINGLV